MATIFAPNAGVRVARHATIRPVLALTRTLRRRLAVLVALLAVVGLVAGCGATSGTGGSAGGTASGSALAPASPTTDLRTVAVGSLPKEAVDTLTLIAKGGPYPYPKDGVTFQNRENRLPQRKNGWYQEYTVITPGSSDRGARRIITGQDGARFYTDDHYSSFREVVSGGTS